MPLLIRRLPIGPYDTNSYLIACISTLEAALLDPGGDGPRLIHEASGFKVRYILLTHGHPDHTGALASARTALRAPLGYHPAEKPMVGTVPDLELTDGMELPLGEYRLQVMHLPGHTPGGAGFLLGGDLFSGDTLFPGGPGRTNSPEDLVALARTIKEKLFLLPDETSVYPGHGAGTTIGRERESSRSFIARVEAGWRGSGDLTWESG